MERFYDREYSLKQRVVSWVSGKCTFTYTSRHGIGKGLKRRGGLAFLPSFADATAEEKFFRTLDLDGKIVYDIGGFIGLTTVFFASRARRVFTFEPNPEARLKIEENVRLNRLSDKVSLRPVAIGDTPGRLSLVFDELMSGGSGDPEVSAEILHTAPHPRTVEAEVSTVDLEIERGLPAPDFVKVDVEGMEDAVLAGMRGLLAARKPQVYFELHGTTPEDKLHNATTIIRGLQQAGYRVFDVERGLAIGPDDSVTGRESHVFGS